ncbi:MAG: metallophosphoesterase, partial [Steroidobacteraceae bacterium]
MKIFALSDIHVDYEPNAKWVSELSTFDYRDDVLILAGDVSDSLERLRWCPAAFARCFKRVAFVPGNHDLWVRRDACGNTSLQKLDEVRVVADSLDVDMKPFHLGDVRIVPLLGWYDYSFGMPGDELKAIWMDYHACRWPSGLDVREICRHLCAQNRWPSTGDGTYRCDANLHTGIRETALPRPW